MRIDLGTVPLVQVLKDDGALRPVQQIATNTWILMQETRVATTGGLRCVESIIERAQDSLGNLLDGNLKEILIRIRRYFCDSHMALRLGQSLENDLASILNAGI